MENLQLSVIIVSYNEGEYIKTCIDSCLSQKESDGLEILIGDDCSSDNSLSIIKDYAQKYPQIIRYFTMSRDCSEPVIGSIRASNVIKTGLEKARGKYCLVLSADDYLCDDLFFYEAVRKLESDADCPAVVAKSFKKVWSDNTERIFSMKEVSKRIYWSGMYTHVSCFVFRKALAVDNLLPRFCDDTGLQFSLMHGGKWRFLDLCPFCYRQRDGSIMYESDELELHILELMLLQDILNKEQKRMPYISGGGILSRFAVPLHYVFKNRSCLPTDKYKKYMQSCALFGNDILNDIAGYSTQPILLRLKIDLFVKISLFYSFLFKVVRKLYSFLPCK